MKTEGAGVTTILLVVFVVLKLTDNINWSWWWVLAPFWVPCAIAAFGLLVMGIVAATGPRR